MRQPDSVAGPRGIEKRKPLSFPMRRPGLLGHRSRFHAAHPSRDLSAQKIGWNQAGVAVSHAEHEGDLWIKGKVRCRQRSGEVVADERRLPNGELLAEVSADVSDEFWRALLRCREQYGLYQPLQKLGDILVRLAHHSTLQRALAQVGGEKARFARLFVLQKFHDGRRLEKGEAVVDDHWHAPARVEGAEFWRLQVTLVEREHLQLVRKTLVLEREPDTPPIGRAGRVVEGERHGAVFLEPFV